jgi:hypothetical protein
MTEPVSFRQGGKSKRTSRIELMIKSFGAAALNGNVGAAEALLIDAWCTCELGTSPTLSDIVS